MKYDLIHQQTVTRQGLLGDIEKLDSKVYDKKPEGIRNNILWQVGHILTVTEQFLFGLPKNKMEIPDNYVELYGNGTKPDDWPADVPSMETLVSQLQSQLERIQKLDAEYFDQTLEKPFLGQDTIGGLGSFAVFHEANHVGQIHAMNLMVK